MADGTIIIDTKLENDGIEKGLKELNSEAKKSINDLDGEFKSANMKLSKEFEDAAKKSETSISNMKTKVKGHLLDIGNIAKTSLAGLTTAIVGIGTAGIGVGTAIAKVGSDFEAEMSRVKAISGATTEQFEQLKEQAIQLGADTSFSAKEAADGMELLASAGFNTNEIMSAMPGMLDLAASSGEDLASSADIAASTLRGFGLEADQAAHVADVLAKNAAATNAQVADTGLAMKYVAPVAHSMGLSLEEVTAAIGELADVGIKSEQAGTTLRSALTRLASPSKEAAGAMQELGFNAFDAQGKMLPLGQVIDNLSKSLEGKTEQQKADAIATIFGTESMSGMLALVDAGSGKLNDLTNSYKNADGAAAEMAKTMKDNLKGSIEQLTGSLESLGLQIYYSVNSPLKDTVNGANDMVNQMSKAFKEGGFAGLTQSIGDVLAQIVTNIATYTPKIINASVLVIKSFLTGIKNNLKTITDGAIEIVTSLAKGIIEIAPMLLDIGKQIILNLVESISANLPTLIPQAIECITTIVNGLLDNIDLIIDGGIKLITGLAQGLINGIPKLIEKLPSIITKIVTALINNAPKLIAVGIQLSIEIAKGLVQSIPEIIKAIPQINIAIIQGFKNANWSQIGKDITKSMFSTGVADGANAAVWAKAQIQSLKLAFQNGGIKQLAKDLVASLFPSVSAESANAAIWAKAQLKALKDTFKNGGLKEVAKQLIKDLTPNIAVEASNFATWAKNEISKVKEAFKNADWSGIAQNIIKSIFLGGATVGQEAATWAKNQVESIKTAFNGVDWSQITVNIVNEFLMLPSKIKTGIDNAITTLITGGNTMKDEGGNAGNNTCNAISDALSQLPGKVATHLANTIAAFIPFNSSMGTEGDSSAKSFSDRLIAGLTFLPSRMISIGSNIVAGLRSGISSSWSSMTGWIGGLCSSFVKTVENKFKIQSPSKVMYGIGSFIIQGWRNGLVDNAKMLIETAKSLSSNVINAVQEPIKNLDLANSMIAQFSSFNGTFGNLEKQIEDAKLMVEEANKSNNEEQKEAAKKQQEIAEDNKNKLIEIAEATTDAIKAQLEKEKEAAEKVYNDKLDLLEKEYNTEVDNIDKITKKKTDAIDEQIKALEQETTDTSREDERTASKNNINVLTAKMNNTASEADKRSLALQIADAQKELQAKEDTWDIEDEKAALEEEKTLLEQKAETKKKNLETEYNDNKSAIEKQLKANDEYYDKLLEQDSINAQARYKMLTSSSGELVTLLNSYAPQWQNAGQSLADSLLTGLNSQKENVSSAIDDMISLRNTYTTGSSSTNGGYATGTSYNKVAGFYDTDEKGFETTNGGSVAYVSQGAAINNHMQSMAAIKDEISKQVSEIYNRLKNAVNSEQLQMASMLQNTINTINNSSNVTNRGGDINFNVEKYYNNTDKDIEQTANELGFYANRQRTC